MIEVRDLEKELAGEPVLDGVDLTIDAGEIIALLGASGAGKSVLLKNLVGLMTPDAGEVTIRGINVHTAGSREMDQLRDYLGMLFQDGALFDSMTVYENLAFPLREKTSLTPEEIEARINDRLEKVNMLEAKQKLPAELSGGMQKRVALARTLIRNPEIIFFDEPTTGLDPLIGNSILRLICELHREFNFTAVIVTHNFQKVFQIVHKVAMIHEGKILTKTTPDEFMEADHPAVQSFVNEALKGPLEAVSNGEKS